MTGDPRNRVLAMVEDGALDNATALLCCLKYMSHYEIEDMIRCNELEDKEMK